MPPISESQKKLRHQGKSTVAIERCLSYEENIPKLLSPRIAELCGERIKNRRIFLKINMVDYREGRPLTTDPRLIEALVDMFIGLGANTVAVGDGPALNRDTDYLLEATGIGHCLKKKGLRFVDLNIDDLQKVENPLQFTGLDHFLLPRSVMESELVVSVPKLKTHRWSRFTASMKNLFGVVPGRRYGWPKSLLHQKGVDFSIVDLVASVKPGLCIVDAITAMEGEGPLSGEAVESGFLLAGTDPAAVDATAARSIGIDPSVVRYIQLAGAVIGNIDPEEIDLTGTPLSEISRKFILPARFNHPENSAEAQRQSEFGAT